MLDEPLSQVDARQLARKILAEGDYWFSRHAEQRMTQRGMSQIDCVNVVRGGRCTEIDFEKGSWRYRFETPRMAAVVAFLDENSLTVVSAWRK